VLDIIEIRKKPSTRIKINKYIINQLKHITFLVYNTKISDKNVESGKVPGMLAAFPR
jgi:hypothetical protein